MFDEDILEAVRQEVIDRYDIYDLVNILDLDLEELYTILEPVILKRVAELDLQCLPTGKLEMNVWGDG